MDRMSTSTDARPGARPRRLALTVAALDAALRQEAGL